MSNAHPDPADAAPATPAVDRAAQAAHDAVDRAAQTARDGAASMAARGQWLRESHESLVTETRRHVRANPIVSLGIAAVAGLVLARVPGR
ncbi:MAG: hypothetical protein RLW62_02590 [Gammaproteobacteria bacterium]